MTAHVLITGTLFRPPEQRTSKAGRLFVTATLKVKDGNEIEKRLSLSIVADHVLALRQPSKKRKVGTTPQSAVVSQFEIRPS
jgi:hypothetical protein